MAISVRLLVAERGAGGSAQRGVEHVGVAVQAALGLAGGARGVEDLGQAVAGGHAVPGQRRGLGQ